MKHGVNFGHTEIANHTVFVAMNCREPRTLSLQMGELTSSFSRTGLLYTANEHNQTNSLFVPLLTVGVKQRLGLATQVGYVAFLTS